MNTMKEAALAYAARGWPIFPTRADKKPYITNGVLEATTNQKQIEEWWSLWPKANIALDVGGAGMVVLDIDPGYKEDIDRTVSYDEILNAVEEKTGHLPETQLSQETPRGGQHLFYAKDFDETIPPSASKIANYADVRSFHSYVLLPPSRTADGVYTWESEGKPAYRTDQFAEVASESSRAKHEDRDNWLIEPDLGENIALATKWLREDAKIAVVGQGGDQMTYSTAAMCKSFGLSPEMAFDLMWEFWCPRCSPPWGTDMIEHLELKIENGYSYNTSPPGNMTPAYKAAKAQNLFKPVSRDTSEDGKGSGREMTSGRFRMVDRAGIADITPPDWLIQDAIPQNSYSLLIGPRGTFKTFIALDMALSIATGGAAYFDDGKFFGVWPDIIKPGPVLFAAGEGRGMLKNRVEAWETHHLDGDQAEDFYLIDPVPHPIVEDVTPFIEMALAYSPTGYRLIVIDTVGRAMQGLNENSAQDASLFTQMIETLQKELDCSVLALHHTGHEAKDRSRGSSSFGADVDAEFILERKDKETIVTLTNTKQKDAVEWEHKKAIQLTEIGSSLVATKPSEKRAKQAVEEAEAKPKAGRKTKQGAAIEFSIIRKAAYAVLKGTPGKEYSKSALAMAISADENVLLTGQTIAKNYIGELLTDKAHPVSKCYDTAKGVWRLSKPIKD